MKQGGFFFSVQKILLDFGTARKVPGILSSVSSSLACHNVDGLLSLVSWSEATNTGVVSQPHSAECCTAFCIIFLQQQRCSSLLHVLTYCFNMLRLGTARNVCVHSPSQLLQKARVSCAHTGIIVWNAYGEAKAASFSWDCACPCHLQVRRAAVS